MANRHRHKHPPPPLKGGLGWGVRFALATCGLILLASGLAHVNWGRPIFQNYWGGWVYAPFAIVAGIIALVAGVRGKRFGANRTG